LSQAIAKILEKQEKKQKNPNLNLPAMARGDQRLMELIVAPDGYEFVGRDFCLHPETELLTKHRGWVSVLELNKNDVVWQVDPISLVGSWCKPSRLIARYYEGNMYSFGNRRGKLHVTENHTMLWAGQFHKTRRDKEMFRKITKSQEGVTHSNQNMLFGSESTGIVSDFDLDDINRACAIQADGHLNRHGKYDIQVSKPEKRAELNRLFGPGKVATCIRPGQKLVTERWTSIDFKHPLLEPNKQKDLNVELLGDNQLDVFMSCLSIWDGSVLKYKTKRFIYGTTNLDLANRIQARLVRSGVECRLKVSKAKQKQHKDLITLSVKPGKARLRLRPQDVSCREFMGMVGCVTVETGFILVRSEGQTFVTGNCSLEPAVTAEFSQDFMYTYATQTGVGKKPYWDDRTGVLMISDIYQMFGSKTSFMKERFKSAWDVHGFYDRWLEDPEYVKGHPDIKKWRKFAKVVVLGVERGMGWKKLQKDAEEKAGIKITAKESKQCVKDFWELFEGVKGLKDKLAKEALKHGAFITPLGFRVPCNDYKAYPFFTQAVGNDCLMLYRHLYMELAPWSHYISPIHDELVTMRPIDRRKEDVEAHNQALIKTNEILNWTTPLRMSESYGPDFWSIK